VPLRSTLSVAVLLASSALAQTPEDELRSQIKAVRYPPLAEQARIQGDVHLKLDSRAAQVLSGHPLLAPIAVESAKQFVSILGKAEIDVTFHFVFVDTTTSVRTSVKRGNAFERAFLRMFGMKTEKVQNRCEEGIAPVSDLKVEDRNIEVWIYGKMWLCLQTETSTHVARR
jgi:hypothetical protein